jgi:TetR/AcrR family transcriptional regulator, mexJK operon transcriptional repressor
MTISAEAAPVPDARLDAKRGAIVRGAKQVFLKKGFAGTSMDAVAEKARASKMTVYRHFGSKDALFAGVITELCQQIVGDEFEDMLKLPPARALRAFAEKIVAIVFAPETLELHRIVIAESRRFPELGRMFYESGPEMCINVLARYFSQNRRNLRLNGGSTRRAAEEFLELLRGYAHLRVLLGLEKAPSRREIDSRIGTALRHVLR